MNWIELLERIGVVLLGTGTGIVGTILYFKPKLRQEKAQADIQEVEAEDKKKDYLEDRVKSMEALFNEQGKALDSVRLEVLRMGEKLSKVEQENVRILQENEALKKENETLKKENEGLRLEISNLRSEFDSYKKREK